jgi:hypothetical protein
MKRWTPRVELTKQEQLIRKRLKREGAIQLSTVEPQRDI